MSVQLDDQAKDAAAYPDAPKAQLSTRQRLAPLRRLDTGSMRLRTVYGPVVTLSLGPRGLGPQLAVVTSPRGACDVLGRTSGAIDKGLPHLQFSLVTGPNVFTMRYEQWQPRRPIMQPLFTKKHVATFARPPERRGRRPGRRVGAGRHGRSGRRLAAPGVARIRPGANAPTTSGIACELANASSLMFGIRCDLPSVRRPQCGSASGDDHQISVPLVEDRLACAPHPP